MLPAFIPIAALLCSDALLLVGHGLLLTLLPIAGSNAGFSDTQVAFTGSAYFLGFVFGCMATPRMLQRVGHIRSFAVLASIYSAIVLLFSWLPLFWAWLLLRFFVGAAISGLYMIIESWLNERADATNRGTILSIYTVLNLLMMTLGQQLIGWFDANYYHLFTLAAIVFSLAIIPVSMTLSLAPAQVHDVRLNLAKVWRNSHAGLIGAMAAGLVSGSFWALAPVYARASGFDNAQLAAFMSATILGGACCQFPLGRLSDRYDRRIVLMYTAVAGAFVSIAIALITVLSDHFSGLVAAVLAFCWGGTSMTLYAIALAHINDNTDAADFVEIGSGMLLTLGLCSAIGAPIAASMMTLLGSGGLYIYMAICLTAYSVIVSIRRDTHVLPDMPESQEGFRSVTDMATPQAFELDPRGSDAEPPEKPAATA